MWIDLGIRVFINFFNLGLNFLLPCYFVDGCLLLLADWDLLVKSVGRELSH